MNVTKAFLLAIQLLVNSIINCLFRGKSLKISLGYSILLQFSKAAKASIKFQADTRTQKKVIFLYAYICRLIDDSIEKNELSDEQMINILHANQKEVDHRALEISKMIRDFEKYISTDQRRYFNDNFEKLWLTNEIRTGKKIGDAMKAAEDRGGHFFIALIYALNPKNLNQSLVKTIYTSGAWFQLLDDYRDRKKDRNIIKTIFTTSKNETPQNILEKNVAKYNNEIQNNLGRNHPITKLMLNLTILIRRLDFIKLDWK